MEEFPGDNPDNIPQDEDGFDLPRSPERVLDQLGHTFRIGINGFGSLGRAVFCKAFDRAHIEVAAINDPNVDALQAASLIREEHSQGRIGPIGLEILARGPGILELKDPSTGRMRTVLFSSEPDPSQITWQDPQRPVFHVIECSAKFVTVEKASGHLQTDLHTSAEQRGALKVLIASSTTDAPRFYPGINLRDYQVEQCVFACAPPAGSIRTNDDVWQYSSYVLDLLSLALARDSAAASWSSVEEEGRQGGPLPGGESLFANCLRFNLMYFRRPDIYPDCLGGELEMGNSEFMHIWNPCACCPKSESVTADA